MGRLKATFCDESEQQLMTAEGFYRHCLLEKTARKVNHAAKKFIDKALESCPKHCPRCGSHRIEQRSLRTWQCNGCGKRFHIRK